MAIVLSGAQRINLPKTLLILGILVLLLSSPPAAAFSLNINIGDFSIRFGDKAERELLAAIYKKNLEKAKETLEKYDDLDVNTRYKEGVSPLMQAAKSGALDITQWLVDQGAEVNAESEYGWTPLMFASHYGHLEVIRYLIDKGAQINHRSKPIPQSWYAAFKTVNDSRPASTALHESMRSQQLDIVRLLIEHGANIDVEALARSIRWGNVEIADYIHEKAQAHELRLTTEQQNDLFVRFASYSEFEKMRWMHQHGVDINGTHLFNRTALIASMRMSRSEKIINYLLSNGADVNAYGGTSKYSAETPLTAASKRGRSDWVARLLALGADANVANADGETPLEIAKRIRDRWAKSSSNNGKNLSKRAQRYQDTVDVLTQAGFK